MRVFFTRYLEYGTYVPSYEHLKSSFPFFEMFGSIKKCKWFFRPLGFDTRSNNEKSINQSTSWHKCIFSQSHLSNYTGKFFKNSAKYPTVIFWFFLKYWIYRKSYHHYFFKKNGVSTVRKPHTFLYKRNPRCHRCMNTVSKFLELKKKSIRNLVRYWYRT